MKKHCLQNQQSFMEECLATLFALFRSVLGVSRLKYTLIPLMLVTGCSQSAASTHLQDTSLKIEVLDSQAVLHKASLDCSQEEATGYLRGKDLKSLCLLVEKEKENLAPLSDNLTCTEIYGGPETANIKGEIKGKSTKTSFNRTNGCYISQWDSVKELFTPKNLPKEKIMPSLQESGDAL